jgi:hypothetical protein
MKQLKYLFVVFISLMSSTVFAQGKNSIKFNLLSPLVQTVSIFYERELTNEHGVGQGLQLGLNYTNFKVGHAKYEGYGWTPEVRIYPFESKDFKVYAAPFGLYQNSNLEVVTYDANSLEITENANFTKYGGGIIFGGKLNFKDMAVLDVFLGPAYVSDHIDVKNGSLKKFAHFDLALGTLSGYGLRAGIAVGLVF